jgi:Fe-S-cluster-containing dehydrogenase component/CRP-like cAMP-binding protein
MPQKNDNETEILEAIECTCLLADVPLEVRKEWLKGFVDSGNGKRSGPLVSLVSYQTGETLMRENEWGGNTFMILVSGKLDVLMKDPQTGFNNKVNEVHPNQSFAEMSLFAGVPRNASVVAVGPAPSVVLEIKRQAFRGNEKKTAAFIEQLGGIYKSRGLSTAIERIRQSSSGSFTASDLDLIKRIGSFQVFGRSHKLCEQGQSMDKAYLIIEGWVRRSRDLARVDDSGGWARVAGENVEFSFRGGGNLIGFEGLTANPSVWNYTTIVMLRTEVMEIDLAALRADPELLERAQKLFAPFSGLDSNTRSGNTDDRVALESLEKIGTTGIVEADNVLVMDMDLCIRCGNCSFACEKVHGQSRLVRRGIHIERSPEIAEKKQHILVPEVCISCMDPECLTGCPTGAIARLAQGQIDIERATCTGCAACARLCPYNAISMIEENRCKHSPPGFASQLGTWLGLTAPVLPPPVTGTKKDNVIAVKCNLCADKPINPTGTLKPVYSCEENCPTGALVRVNPGDYFGEAEKQRGLRFQTPTMAVGRNIHRHDPAWWWCHIIGGILILLTLLVELLAYKYYGFNQPSSSRFPTLPWITTVRGITGIIGAAAAVIAGIGYSIRHRQYTRRAGPLRYWMLGHIYLGLIAVTTIMLHGGSHSGGPLTTTLMVSFDLVLLTGLLGVVSYYVSPRLLTSLEGDPLLLEDLEARRAELRAEVFQTREQKDAEQLFREARRRFGSIKHLLKQIRRREELSALLASIRDEYRPLLSLLPSEVEQAALLDDIQKLATIRRLDALIYLHRLLKVWLPPHIIASILMVGLLCIHILQVMAFRLIE